MNIVIVFPVPPDGCPSHFKCGDDDVFIRSHTTGLKSLVMDTVVLLPGCSAKQKAHAIDKTVLAENPIILQ